MSALRPALLAGGLAALAGALIAIAATAAGAPDVPASDATAQPPRARAQVEREVLSVSDGDSFAIRTPNDPRQRIRIAGIDAPEADQPFGDAARAHLSELLSRTPLRIEAVKTDPFGRLVANVYAGDTDVGLAMVEAGLAWHFKRYAKDQTAAQRARYAAAERRARAARAGLWAAPDPVPPWTYRATQARSSDPRP